MSEILTNQKLYMKNVLSFRDELSPYELQRKMESVSSFIESGSYKTTGPSVSATYNVEQRGNEQILDMEIFIPLDKPFTPPEGWEYKSEFRLANLVSIRHYGDPADMQTTANSLMEYLQENGLRPTTCAYNVTVQEPESPTDIDQMIVDIYIGVSSNIL